MSEIEEPDEQGGIDKDTGVSFIIIPARSGKGLQAAAVTIADPPVADKTSEPATPITAIEDSFGELRVGEETQEAAAVDPDAPVDLEDPNAW